MPKPVKKRACSWKNYLYPRFDEAKVEKDTRLDIAARGFWMRGQKVLCDIRVFNPLAKCYRNKSLAKCHEAQEKEKN